MKKVMIEYGGKESTPAIIDNHEEKRVWIKTNPSSDSHSSFSSSIINTNNKVYHLKN